MLKILEEEHQWKSISEEYLPFDQDVLEEAFVHRPFLELLVAREKNIDRP